jgi:hypothetical protein
MRRGITAPAEQTTGLSIGIAGDTGSNADGSDQQNAGKHDRPRLDTLKQSSFRPFQQRLAFRFSATLAHD